jgi:hypothetical protein
MEVKFYVEGPSDCKFLQDVVKQWYNIVLSKDAVDVLNGKDSLDWEFDKALTNNAPSFITDQTDDIRSVVILDADADPVQRRQEVAALAQKHSFDYFLWPDNMLSGDLESILEQIYNPTHQPFFDCWRAYEQCLTGKGDYYLPNRKGKIYAYLEALLAKSEMARKQAGNIRGRDFMNQDHWNLSPTQPTLQPLKAFLDVYFQR